MVTLASGRSQSRSLPRYAVRRPPLNRVAVLATLAVFASATPAAAASPRAVSAVGRAVAELDGSGDVRVARDVSFPQCGGPLPSARSGSVGVLGTNNGTAFSTNPCLVQQLAWAKHLAQSPAFYANTGNPGPSRGTHWPIGQTSPKVCRASDPNSIGCSYDYGWNAGHQSFSLAAAAAQQLHHVGRDDARHRAANVEWWLDVETMNSWLAVDGSPSRSAELRDAATIAGEISALQWSGVTQIGIYSTAYQWDLITGGAHVTGGQFGSMPQWLAGYESKAAAIVGCSDATFMHGRVAMTQYLASDGFDADVVCTDAHRD
jgi:hypothetical protein